AADDARYFAGCGQVLLGTAAGAEEQLTAAIRNVCPGDGRVPGTGVIRNQLRADWPGARRPRPYNDDVQLSENRGTREARSGGAGCRRRSATALELPLKNVSKECVKLSDLLPGPTSFEDYEIIAAHSRH